MKKLITPELGTFNQLEKVGLYSFGLGLPNSEIHNIIKYSNDLNDKGIQDNTSDLKRFKTEQTLKKWYNDEGRFIFSLLGPNGEIAGFWQGRPSKQPIFKKILNNKFYFLIINNIKKNHTSGIRIYPTYRGKGLAQILLTLSHKYYKRIYPNYIMTIDIDKKNIASQKSFERFGYKIVGYGENQKTVKAQEQERIIYIYSL